MVKYSFVMRHVKFLCPGNTLFTYCIFILYSLLGGEIILFGHGTEVLKYLEEVKPRRTLNSLAVKAKLLQILCIFDILCIGTTSHTLSLWLS